MQSKRLHDAGPPGFRSAKWDLPEGGLKVGPDRAPYRVRPPGAQPEVPPAAPGKSPVPSASEAKRSLNSSGKSDT